MCQEGSSLSPVWQFMTVYQSLLFILLSLSHPVVLMLVFPPRPPAPLPSSLTSSNSETSPTHFLSLSSGFTFWCESFMSEKCPPEEMFCRVACPHCLIGHLGNMTLKFPQTNTTRAIGTFCNFTASGKGLNNWSMCVLVWFSCHCVLISSCWTTLHAAAPRWASPTSLLLAPSQVTWPRVAGAAKFAHRYWHPATARPQNLHTFYRLSQRIESAVLTIVQKSAPSFLQLRPAVQEGPPPAQEGWHKDSYQDAYLQYSGFDPGKNPIQNIILSQSGHLFLPFQAERSRILFCEEGPIMVFKCSSKVPRQCSFF